MYRGIVGTNLEFSTSFYCQKSKGCARSIGEQKIEGLQFSSDGTLRNEKCHSCHINLNKQCHRNIFS